MKRIYNPVAAYYVVYFWDYPYPFFLSFAVWASYPYRPVVWASKPQL